MRLMECRSWNDRGGGAHPQLTSNKIELVTHTSESASLLWAGRLRPVTVAHCDLPLLHGYLSYRPARGSCEIRSSSPNLWFTVERALGFRVTSLRCQSTHFAAMVSPFCPDATRLGATPRRCNTLPDVIFSDALSLPWGDCHYWAHWATPHEFFVSVGDTDLEDWGGRIPLRSARLPPFGWTARSVSLTHCESGGATTGRWLLVAWYPPGHSAAMPAPIVPQPWFPIRAFVNDRAAATPVPVAEVPEDLPPTSSVVRSGGTPRVSGAPLGSIIHQWGLFPASDLGARVLLASSGCPSGWGVRPLSWLELAALWDVPILVMDAFSEESSISILQGFCASAPAKVLFAGADALLTTLFRGGSGAIGSLVQSSNEVAGPSPRSNTDLGLVVSPPTEEEDNCRFAIRVVKGDSQKADGAAVPDRLWIHAFLEGYAREGTEGDSRLHLRALGLPDHAAVGHLRETGPPSQGIGWEASLGGFRTLGLARWRRQLLRGFHEWRKINVRVNRGCTPGQMARHIISTRGNEAYTAFACNKGRAAYKAQWGFIRSKVDGLATIRAGHDALRRSANASWFEWLEGSAPFFWNWGVEYQRGVRDGQPHYITGAFPNFMQPQTGHKDPAKHELMRAKVVQVRKRGYILPGKVVGGTHYFCVDKGEDDIRMVYNGTSCGLNDVLWAPRFGLPTVKQTLRALLAGYCQCDLDIGEQFLNFPLHTDLREYSGVDVRGVQSLNQGDQEWEDERGPAPWERWERNWMGLRDSPYRSLQWQVHLKLEVYGDRKALDNPYHWDRVEFNLPGSKGYRSDLPWVMKIRCDGHLAAEIFVYVNDGRATGHSPRLTWAAARAYAAGCSRRGVQDASRKRTSLSDTPGPWAGTVTHTTGGRVLGMVSQGKWDKTKLLIAELGDKIPKGPLPLQRLLEIRGFLMYVVWTYTWLNPYIKGLHLTVDSWRPGRAEDGFKWTAKERRRMQYHGTEEGGLPC